MKVERTIKSSKRGNSEYRTVKVTFEGKTYKLNQYGEPGELLRSNWRMSKTQFKNLIAAYPTLFFIKSAASDRWEHATRKQLEQVLQDINDYEMKVDYNMEKNIIEVWSLPVEGWLLGFEGNVSPDNLQFLE